MTAHLWSQMVIKDQIEMRKSTQFTKHSGFVADVIGPKDWESARKDPWMVRNPVAMTVVAFAIAMVIVLGTVWLVLLNDVN
jgi:hypothetical protein